MKIIKYKQLNENENFEELEKGDKEDIENDKGKKKFLINGVLSIISCIINTLGYFSVYIQKNFIVYLISYRRYYNNKLTFSYGYFLFPILNLTTALTIPIGGFFEDKIGQRKTIILSLLILCSAFTLLYLFF